MAYANCSACGREVYWSGRKGRRMPPTHADAQMGNTCTGVLRAPERHLPAYPPCRVLREYQDYDWEYRAGWQDAYGAAIGYHPFHTIFDGGRPAGDSGLIRARQAYRVGYQAAQECIAVKPETLAGTWAYHLAVVPERVDMDGYRRWQAAGKEARDG